MTARDDGGISYSVTIEEPRGFPDTIVRDLERAHFEAVEDCDIIYSEDTNTVEITAVHSVAAKNLYDWLEETRQYYRENFADASGDHDAAEQMANALYEVMSS